MTRITLAKLTLCLAALFFAAKPFVGFGLPHHLRSSVKTNIVVKIFSKRKIEDGRSSMSAIAKQLSDPGAKPLLRFCVLLTLLFPLAFKAIDDASTGLSSRRQASLQPQPVILFTGQLLI